MDFKESIIKDWGLGSLPEAKQKEMVDHIGRIIFQAILVRSLDILSSEEQAELDFLLDRNETTPRDIMLFLKAKIPTFDALLKEERDKLKEELVLSTV